MHFRHFHQNKKFDTQKPILLKIAPDLNNIQLDEIIELVAETSIDGIIASNTSINRENLKVTSEKLDEVGLDTYNLEDLERWAVRKSLTKHAGNISKAAEELGLTPGIQRIFTLFKIDTNGNVVDIQARAPHKRLQEEAISVITFLPTMEPGKQQGTPVKVRYSMPIVFKVQ